ncbi:unnamed protein product [Prorocentrum cordatum]|uniref:PDZ domain-containing protein n=1 Tax=Prorocentrum cordatum TaxID=2364126 RepID=A0ABN9PX89_9DINO|nr:unnamed protein product [Polarella glacialis]
MAPPWRLLGAAKRGGLLAAAEEGGGPRWEVGKRHRLVRETALYPSPRCLTSADETSDGTCSPSRSSSATVVTFPPSKKVLLLAVSEAPVAAAERGADLAAFVADTAGGAWVAGWCPSEALGPRCRSGGWEAGARHRVTGNPRLRAGASLASEELGSLGPGEEVLLLELAMAQQAHSAEPLLRARVRTDGGAFGWITVEMPGGPPLLDPLNLYSSEAMRSPVWCGRLPPVAVLPETPRLTLNCAYEGTAEGWEPDGQYRVLRTVTLRSTPAHDSALRSTLTAGAVVRVHEVRRVTTPSGCTGGHDGPIRLHVSAVPVAERGQQRRGWISSERVSGQRLLDPRNLLEFDRAIGACAKECATIIPSAPSTDRVVQREFSVVLPREHGRALGLRAGHSESGHALLVEDVAGGGLLEMWNRAYPSRQVIPGDEIVGVNGRSGDSRALAEELAEARRLEVVVRGTRWCEEPEGPPCTPSTVSEASSASELATAKAEGAVEGKVEGALDDLACGGGDEAPPEVGSPPQADAPGAAAGPAAAPPLAAPGAAGPAGAPPAQRAAPHCGPREAGGAAGPAESAGTSRDPHDWRPFADAQHFDLEGEGDGCMCRDGDLFGCGGRPTADGHPRGPGLFREPAPEPRPLVRKLGGAPLPEPAGQS